MPYNDIQKRATAKWNAKSYDEIKLRVGKGQKSELQSHAQDRGESLNGFVNRAITETLARDRGKSVEKVEQPKSNVLGTEPSDIRKLKILGTPPKLDSDALLSDDEMPKVKSPPAKE